MTREGQGVTLIPLSVRTGDFHGGGSEGHRGPWPSTAAASSPSTASASSWRSEPRRGRSNQKGEQKRYRLKRKSRGESLCFLRGRRAELCSFSAPPHFSARFSHKKSHISICWTLQKPHISIFLEIKKSHKAIADEKICCGVGPPRAAAPAAGDRAAGGASPSPTTEGEMRVSPSRRRSPSVSFADSSTGGGAKGDTMDGPYDGGRNVRIPQSPSQAPPTAPFRQGGQNRGRRRLDRTRRRW